jgi:diaminohydroxyphosphoribosylaminopyrimidine deaminase/5-amino-6-(5-phosphoribosylamino)uracil reductase
LRRQHDAVLVGAGTARSDDPALTVRGFGHVRQPVRIVVSRRLDLPLTGQLAQTAKDVPLWICHGADADRDRKRAWSETGATLVQIKGHGGHLDPMDMLQTLGQAGLTRIFCEGGGALAASLLTADVVDDLYGFTAGLLIGAEGMPSVGALGLSDLSEAPRFRLHAYQKIGLDILHHWRRQKVV